MSLKSKLMATASISFTLSPLSWWIGYKMDGRELALVLAISFVVAGVSIVIMMANTKDL